MNPSPPVQSNLKLVLLSAATTIPALQCCVQFPNLCGIHKYTTDSAPLRAMICSVVGHSRSCVSVRLSVPSAVADGSRHFEGTNPPAIAGGSDNASAPARFTKALVGKGRVWYSE